MAKVKPPFFQNCGAQYAKWQGQCNPKNGIQKKLSKKEEKVAWKSESASKSKAPKPLKSMK
jgi:DNA repair protein RadA/Sms